MGSHYKLELPSSQLLTFDIYTTNFFPTSTFHLPIFIYSLWNIYCAPAVSENGSPPRSHQTVTQIIKITTHYL